MSTPNLLFSLGKSNIPPYVLYLHAGPTSSRAQALQIAGKDGQVPTKLTLDCQTILKWLNQDSVERHAKMNWMERIKAGVELCRFRIDPNVAPSSSASGAIIDGGSVEIDFSDCVIYPTCFLEKPIITALRGTRAAVCKLLDGDSK